MTELSLKKEVACKIEQGRRERGREKMKKRKQGGREGEKEDGVDTEGKKENREEREGAVKKQNSKTKKEKSLIQACVWSHTE